MKIIKTFLVTVLLIILLAACEDFPFPVKRYYIKVENKSGEDLVVGLSILYPDTTVSMSYDNRWHGGRKGGGADFENRKKWEQYIPNNTARDTLSLFFISLDTFEKYGAADVIQNYRILTRKDFGIDYLHENDFTIVYP
jgi:hypothetical protein